MQQSYAPAGIGNAAGRMFYRTEEIMINKFVLTAAFALLAGSASAECPAKPPQHNWNTMSGDKAVSAAYLTKLLTGRKARWSGAGVERYMKNGKYSYSQNGQTWRAPGYRFYDGGIRCIGYDAPRFDRYVVSNGNLMGINWAGARLVVQVTK